MKVEMKLNHGKGPGINIHGPHVTPLVHGLFSYALNSNRIDCPWYKARKECSAFFQGGSGEPDGGWVFIEFWHPDGSTTFLDLINQALSYVNEEGEPKRIQMATSDVAMLRWVNGLTNFYEAQVVEVEGDKWIIEYDDPLMLTSIIEKAIVNPGVFTPID